MAMLAKMVMAHMVKMTLTQEDHLLTFKKNVGVRMHLLIMSHQHLQMDQPQRGAIPQSLVNVERMHPQFGVLKLVDILDKAQDLMVAMIMDQMHTNQVI